uniref:Dynein axonemal assembly factor 4 n=1 Tax=Hucho hucho TaxID=62062 RepID=A0A4W5PZU9_9TELE
QFQLFCLRLWNPDLFTRHATCPRHAVFNSLETRALLKAQGKFTAESKAKATKTQEERKYALETMMMLEEEGRARIQKMKDDECEKATAQLEAWKLKQGQIAEGEAQLKLQSQRIKVPKQSKSEKIHVPRTSDQGQKNSVQSISKKKQVDLPAPRSTGNIQIKFTPQVFPTALRESRWLQKQAEARRAVNADLAELKDLTEEERNPDWLKKKGDKLFATGNYLAAINAYSLAIKLNRKISAIYSNGAACHLKLRNLHKALDLLTPPVPGNAGARTGAHVRRGTAFCELEFYTEGLCNVNKGISQASKLHGSPWNFSILVLDLIVMHTWTSEMQKKRIL